VPPRPYTKGPYTKGPDNPSPGHLHQERGHDRRCRWSRCGVYCWPNYFYCFTHHPFAAKKVDGEHTYHIEGDSEAVGEFEEGEED